ncbi:hypothetical protein CPB83DRAFT_858711 [Crepidotus variabilis]|uniref:Uncharacterized protein n=1 Tax=Crepidotus variabilis TaxID=179855 RepID=A0A9P6EBV1_9AGAR|nr:hypothetical protein CPB83DRAFT_858711 [Crepidotus variabilis]
MERQAGRIYEGIQFQFIAYAQGTFPFNPPLGACQPLLEWWQSFEATPDGGILAAIAIKLYFAVPHSMVDERTTFVTMLNSAPRSPKKVDYHCHGPGSWLLSSRERCSAPAKLPLLTNCADFRREAPPSEY